MRFGNLVGKDIKVDETTTLAIRSKFVHVCVLRLILKSPLFRLSLEWVTPIDSL